jgi:N-acetylglucosamine-6-sulfatase
MSTVMNRREAARLLAGSALAAGAAAAPPRRPNFVFILLDDQRWDSLSCLGHPFLKTPHIDRIGNEGVIFRNFFVTTPLCSPSRASFLTGRYVHSHGVTGNGDNNEVSHRLVTWPRLLRDAGYETGYVGKWHMGNDDSPRPGIDYWVSFRGQGQYIDPVLNVNGTAAKAPGYVTDLLSDHAVNFLRRPHSKPFALYLAHKAVHGPFTPAGRHKDLYASDPIPRRPNCSDTLEGKPALTRGVQDRPARRKGIPNNEQLIRNQLRCIQAVDDGVGRVLQTLEETRQLDNTVIVYASDNGYFWGEHGLGDKRWSYEESIRDPLLVRYPRLIKAGSKATADALNIDIGPTMLELAGVRAPKEMQGRSLVPVLRGNARNWRQSFLIEYFAEKAYPRTPSWQGVRTPRWKYTHYAELPGMDELYDIEADPCEMKNRIADPAAASALKQMQAELQRLVRETA